MRPFAVFDIDGTVIRWQLYHALGDALAKRGQINAEAFNQVRGARMDWKKRSDPDAFRDYEAELVRVFDESLTGMNVDDFEQAANDVFEEYKDQVYTYTRDLIKQLKSKNYLLFAISGSPNIIVSKLAQYYGFDDFYATDYKVDNARFTGEVELSLGKKPERLQKLITKHDASTIESIAVGDSEGDITMLKSVEHPSAFNPSAKLYEHAKQQGWQIVVERKNVVYQLESHNESYLLA